MNDKRKTLTPKVRFREFRTDWSTKRLDAIAQPIVERAGNRPITPYTVTTGVGLISQQDRFGRAIAGNAFKNYYVLRKDDFAYNKSATKAYPQGYIARFLGNEGAVPNSIFTCFRVDPDVIDPTYLDYLFASNLHGRWLRRFIEVSARAHGSLSVDDADLMSLPVPVPEGTSSLAEQRKIAACLTSLDECIAAEGRKLEALRAHKKGLTQQLFPCDRETRPRLRFSEFRENEQLEFRPIGEIATVTTGNKDTQNKVEGGEYPFFVRSQNVERINSFSYDGEAVLISGDGVGVGENYHYINGRFDFHQRVYSIYDFDASVSGQFFFHYFSTHFTKRVKQMSAKNSVDSVRMAMITEMPIWLPSIVEQQRIAGCLSSLDGVIVAQSQKLDGLRAHKSGLMQELFPSPAGSKQ